TFRHERFPAYKATRDEMPEDLSLQLPHVKRLIEAFHIPVIECPGYEADDVIGTLAKQAEALGGFTTYMVTPDKDYAQLVTDSTLIYKPGRQGSAPEILDPAKIREQWEVNDPLQTIDILGLWGDASDNIPGVPGIGEKTAKKLISEFGSVESLLEHTDRLKGKQRENIEAHREQALLSKELVTILTSAPVTTRFDEIEIGPRNDEAIRSLFVEFEFNALGKRLFGGDFQAGRGHATAETESGELVARLRTIDDFEKHYRFVRADDAAGRKALVAELRSLPSWCFDLETTSLDEKTTSVIGLAFSWQTHHATYVEVPAGDAGRAVLEEFREILADPGIEKIGHNLKFDIGVLLWQGIPVDAPIFDTMLAHSLVEPEQRHKMDYLAESLLGYTPISFDSVFGKTVEKTGQLSLFDEAAMSGAADETPVGPAFEEIARYACEDADVTWQLAAI
ncbi:MAG TPA: 5'-3' exonuclease H3TH domain-containing protein, partial [Bacteroidia bacterium]|nr:5'-3' exonuclease H3TH domain-containing protein [Bacteroidia bacterium]